MLTYMGRREDGASSPSHFGGAGFSATLVPHRTVWATAHIIGLENGGIAPH